MIWGKPFRFEDMGRLFLQRLIAHAGGALDERPRRIIVGRPVEYAGARPDPELARPRYDAMLAAFGTEVYYVQEPLGAAIGRASGRESGCQYVSFSVVAVSLKTK